MIGREQVTESGTVIIAWHPTFERFVEALRPLREAFSGDTKSRPEPNEVFLVLPSELDLRLIERMCDPAAAAGTRVSLVMTAASALSIDYALLRRMQHNQWTLALCQSTDDLADRCNSRDPTASLGRLEEVIEVARKFRVDVDFILTVPNDRLGPAEANNVFKFLTFNRVRRVSFGYPLLLSKLGVQAPTGARPSRFFAAFLEIWLASKRAIHIHDVQLLADKAMVSREGNSRASLSTLFVDAKSEYWNVDGPVPDLCVRDCDSTASPPRSATTTLRNRCATSCEYYRICGGEFYGAKVAFNGTIDSATNPYCDVVAKRIFDCLLSLETTS